MKAIKTIKDIPLQQRKQARTRLALLDAAIEMMRKKTLADITVEEICQKAEVSRGTFFRYFPRKTDLLYYHVRLWSIESVWHARQLAGEKSGLAIIEAYFEWSVNIITKHPRLFSEIIALRAYEPLEIAKRMQNDNLKITQAERFLRFPGMKGIDSILDGTFYIIFQESIEEAIAKREIPENVDMKEVILSLASIFYGVPFMLADQTTPIDLTAAFKRQLHILWAGLRHAEWSGEIFQT